MEQVGAAQDNLVGEMYEAMWHDLVAPEVKGRHVVVATTRGI